MTESNPLCHILPIDISDSIFQHFTGAELLTLSEVSPSFYNFTAASKACMEKIAINLEGSKMTEEEKQILVESQRKYKHLELVKSSALLVPARQILKTSGRKWSSAVVSAVNFKTIEDARTFLETIQADVEKLVLINVGLDNLPDTGAAFEALTFPKLKVFETSYCRFLMNHQLFAGCMNLKTLAITSGVVTNSSKEGVQKMLEANGDLTVLRLGQMVTKSILKEDISKSVKFSLKEFVIEGPYYDYSDRENEVYKQNLNLFLQTQASSLEKITIGEESGAEIMKTIGSMPNLTRLKVMSLGHHSSN